MKKLLSALVACAALAASPAMAAWSVTQITNTQVNGATSLATGNLTIASGHLVVVLGLIHGTTLTSITDGAGNSYGTPYTCQRGANADYGFIGWSVLGTGLSAQKITVTAGASTVIVYSVIDVAGFDSGTVEDTAARACNFNNSNTTSPTVTSGTPTYSGDLFVSTWAVPSTATGASFTAGGSWQPTGGYGTGNTSGLNIADWLDATGSGAAQTNNPTTNSKTYAMPITAFKAAPAGTTVQPCIIGSGVMGC